MGASLVLLFSGTMTASPLHRLEHLRETYTPDAAAERLRLLRLLERARFARPRELERLHDAVCFSRAYPDGPEVLAQAETMCERFRNRGDLRRQRDALLNTGIAGTDIAFRFYWPTARWLAKCWPDRLSIDWEELKDDSALLRLLNLLVTYSETAALYEDALDARVWLGRLKGPDETDATFLVRRMEALDVPERVRERLFDDLDLPFLVNGGPAEKATTESAPIPSRTAAFVSGFPPVFMNEPRDRARPDLAQELLRPAASIRGVSAHRGAQLVDLAREAMVVRARDLDAIAYANPADVFSIDDGDGVQFVGHGMLPERRFLLEGTYVFLVLRNGVPVGYMQGSGLLGWAEINFNVFPPFRGREAGRLYGRSVALLHHLMGVDTFVVEPYQLGDGNEEAIASGAWWFYQKLGFIPATQTAARLARKEVRAASAHADYRTDADTLRALAEAPMVLSLGPRGGGGFTREGIATVGRAIVRMMADRFGADRERGLEECVQSACARLQMQDGLRGFSRNEREAMRRWAPLVVLLPHLERWTQDQRQGLVRVIRAKGGRREVDYLAAIGQHEALTESLAELADREAKPSTSTVAATART